MNRQLLAYGGVLGLPGTLGVRLGGRFLLHPGSVIGTLLLLAVSFFAMAWLARRLCRVAGLPRSEWPSGAVALVLPTLVLDPLTSAFFPQLFPGVAPSAAGVFGGWMLACCAGALIGVTTGSVIGTASEQTLAR